MASKKQPRKAVKRALSKEVDLPIKVPNNKVGEQLTKKRRVFFAKYVSESFVELKKVTWPSRREAIKLTIAVIIFTSVFTILLSIADFGIGNLVERVLL